MPNPTKRITVKELIDALKKCNSDSPVAMSSDAEGNQVHYLQNVENPGAFMPDQVVVLWPTHEEV